MNFKSPPVIAGMARARTHPACPTADNVVIRRFVELDLRTMINVSRLLPKPLTAAESTLPKAGGAQYVAGRNIPRPVRESPSLHPVPLRTGRSRAGIRERESAQ
jgi:hypothetical protein